MSYTVIFVIALILLIAVMRKRNASKAKENLQQPSQVNNSSNAKKIKNLPPEIQEALASGNKLRALKLYKQYANCSVQEAKAMIDSLS